MLPAARPRAGEQVEVLGGKTCVHVRHALAHKGKGSYSPRPEEACSGLSDSRRPLQTDGLRFVVSFRVSLTLLILPFARTHTWLQKSVKAWLRAWAFCSSLQAAPSVLAMSGVSHTSPVSMVVPGLLSSSSSAPSW